MTLSLRASLTAWFTALASLVVGTASLALYFVVRDSLLQGLDAELLARARGIAAACEWEDGKVQLEGVYETGVQGALLEQGPFEVRVLPNRTVAVAHGGPLPEPLPESLPGSPPGPDHRATTGPGGLRVVTLPVAFPAVPAANGGDEPATPAFAVEIRVGKELAPVLAQLDRIAWLAAAIGALSLLLGVAFGLFLSRRVTAPLERLGDAAARVRDGHAANVPRARHRRRDRPARRAARRDVRVAARGGRAAAPIRRRRVARVAQPGRDRAERRRDRAAPGP